MGKHKNIDIKTTASLNQYLHLFHWNQKFDEVELHSLSNQKQIKDANEFYLCDFLYDSKLHSMFTIWGNITIYGIICQNHVMNPRNGQNKQKTLNQ